MVPVLRNDALASQLAGVRENGRAISLEKSLYSWKDHEKPQLDRRDRGSP
jgi:hypothetical protein